MSKKRRRDVVTQRQEVAQAALAAHVDPEELDGAAILAQMAFFLTQHPRIGQRIAFKGGAVMKLLDGSPRFSGDLDGVAIAGKPVERKWIEEALWDNPEAQKVFLGTPRIVNKTSRGISFPIVECRAIGSGKSPITVKLSINWSEPLVLGAVWRPLPIHGKVEPVMIPTVDARERAAEKVRALLERADVNDGYDLDQFAGRGFTAEDWTEIERIVPLKLQNSTVDLTADLRALFDSQLEAVKRAWPGDLKVAGGTPNWDQVKTGIGRFRQTMPRAPSKAESPCHCARGGIP
jgi:predicted nucleotidyltransferase component of viral defense system